MIDNGIIHIIDAGYGSVHDSDQFVIAICDDCIKENLEDATLLYYGTICMLEKDMLKKKRKNLNKNIEEEKT